MHKLIFSESSSNYIQVVRLACMGGVAIYLESCVLRHAKTFVTKKNGVLTSCVSMCTSSLSFFQVLVDAEAFPVFYKYAVRRGQGSIELEEGPDRCASLEPGTTLTLYSFQAEMNSNVCITSMHFPAGMEKWKCSIDIAGCHGPAELPSPTHSPQYIWRFFPGGGQTENCTLAEKRPTHWGRPFQSASSGWSVPQRNVGLEVNLSLSLSLSLSVYQVFRLVGAQDEFAACFFLFFFVCVCAASPQAPAS